MIRPLTAWQRGVGIAMVSMALALLAACTSKSTKPAPPVVGEPKLAVVPPAAVGTGPTVKDLRPPADKKRDMHSLLIFSCDYGISTLPELPGNPTGPSTLANEMAATPGDPWRGQAVDVLHYATYLNQKRMLKGQVAMAAGGLLPALLAQAGDDCKEAKVHGGYYAGTEIVNYFPPIVVEMTVRIAGVVHHQRTVYSPMPAIDPALKQPWETAQVLQAMTKADHALLASLNPTSAMVRPPAPAKVSPPAPGAEAGGDDTGFINTNPGAR